MSAHRRASRLAGIVMPASRGTSSKSPRFIRHRRRFGDFPSQSAAPTAPPRGGSQGADKSVRPSSFYIVYTNGSPGFFSTGAGVAAATRVPLRTDRVKNTLPPTTEPLPMSVSPPRMDAPE